MAGQNLSSEILKKTVQLEIARIKIKMPPAGWWSLAWPSNDDRQSSQMIAWLSMIELNAVEAPDVTFFQIFN